jgi:hypothetical protein
MQKMLPTVCFDHEEECYTFTLWRDGKKVVHEFKGFSVSINSSNETVVNGFSSARLYILDAESAKPEEVAQIDGPAIDGQFYYICAVPFRGEDTIIWLSKEEYEILEPMSDEIEEEKFEKQEHEFTRTTLNDMQAHPENYGPEQLALAGYENCHKPLDHE